MNKEEAIKYLQQFYPNGGQCWLDEQRIEAIGMAIKALQEQPVSIWHNMDEIPIKGEVILVQTKDTFYGVSVQKGGTTYKNKNKDRYVRWAYASDLLNLSNVQRTIKNWKEPVSEDLGKVGSLKSLEYYPEKKTTNKTSKGVFDANMPRRKAYLRGFKDGAHAHKELIANKPVSEDFEEALAMEWQGYNDRGAAIVDALEDNTQELAFAKGFYRGTKWQKEKEYACYEEAFEDGAKWKVENLWKPADGDDLPEYEREVVVFTQNYPDDAGMMMVAIGHRPNPDGWDGKSITTGDIEHYTPMTYDKGGWNIPDVKWWLDCSLPNMEED